MQNRLPTAYAACVRTLNHNANPWCRAVPLNSSSVLLPTTFLTLIVSINITAPVASQVHARCF
jgi:hypothetical protein